MHMSLAEWGRHVNQLAPVKKFDEFLCLTRKNDFLEDFAALGLVALDTCQSFIYLIINYVIITLWIWHHWLGLEPTVACAPCRAPCRLIRMLGMLIQGPKDLRHNGGWVFTAMSFTITKIKHWQSGIWWRMVRIFNFVGFCWIRGWPSQVLAEVHDTL